MAVMEAVLGFVTLGTDNQLLNTRPEGSGAG
jgi:hypothetical protein